MAISEEQASQVITELRQIRDELEYLSKTIVKSSQLVAREVAVCIVEELQRRERAIGRIINESGNDLPRYRSMDGVPEVVGADKDGEGGTTIGGGQDG